jgi:hypothetical protein
MLDALILMLSDAHIAYSASCVTGPAIIHVMMDLDAGRASECTAQFVVLVVTAFLLLLAVLLLDTEF